MSPLFVYSTCVYFVVLLYHIWTEGGNDNSIIVDQFLNCVHKELGECMLPHAECDP